MKALSLWQPWASLVVTGHKKVETRSWDTRHTGWIAIHAAGKKPSSISLPGTVEERMIEALGLSDFDQLPRGCIVGAAKLMGTRPTEVVQRLIEEAEPGVVNHMELAFGDYTPGRFAWLFSAGVMLKVPITYRGHQRLFTLDPEVGERVTAQVAHLVGMADQAQRDPKGGS